MPWTPRTTLDGERYYVDPATGRLAWEEPDGAHAGAASREQWTWVEDEKEGWLPAKRSGSDQVQIGGSGAAQALNERRTLPLTRAALDRAVADDLVMLDDINEAMICHTLRAVRLRPSLDLWAVKPRLP